MNYREDKYGNKISILGYGCMRFTQSGGKIDQNKAESEIIRAIDGGVNYFDTAYIYPGSEECLGNILAKNSLRDKVYIATKLPHYLIKSKDALDKYFNEQLKRLKTDHIDYYLMHMLTCVETWDRLKELGIAEWLKDKKDKGEITQVGFSYHGNSDMFIKLLDVYDWDFCQIQYNYMDENSQAGRRGLLAAYERKIPVVIMEPLRGGRLVNKLPKEAINLFDSYEKKYTPVQWALRWLWNQKEVTCVLSGMNSIEMVEDNINTASNITIGEFTKNDEELLNKVCKAINSKMKVGCTGCGYCMPCPMGVDIPGTFAAYNRVYSEGKFAGLKDYFMCTALRKKSTAANNCVKCGKCEKHCPQHIQIPDRLKEAKGVLEPPIYKLLRAFIKFFKAY